MPIVIVPTILRGPTQGAEEIAVDGDTVGACIAAVEEQFPGFAAQVVDPAGEQHPFLKISLNGEILDAGESVRVAVAADDRVEVVAAVAGG